MQSKSSKIQSLFLTDLPIYNGKFINNGSQILFTGNRKHFYYYDLNSNKLEKVSSILGHQGEKNLSKLFVSSNQSDYFAVASQDDPGTIMVLSQKSKTLLFDLKMSGKCESLCFSPNDRYIYSVGD